MTTLGISSGANGSIGMAGDVEMFRPVPVKPWSLGRKGSVTLDRVELICILYPFVNRNVPRSLTAVVERPGVDEKSVAHRFHETVLNVLEDLEVPVRVVDPAAWQKHVLGPTSDLKTASRLRGIQMYPKHGETIKALGNADGVLIAHHYHYSK